MSIVRGATDLQNLYRIKTTGQVKSLTPFGEAQTEVCVHWFHDQRETPPLPYNLIIPGWDIMLTSDNPSERNPEYAQRLRLYVDQLFTIDEIVFIKDFFLQSKSFETVIEEVGLPIINFDIPYRSIPPAPHGGDGYGFIELCGVEDNPLPFRVVGFFDIVYDNPYDRYQTAVVKGLLERSGLAEDGKVVGTSEVQEFNEKLKHLHLTLIDLQRSIDNLSRRFKEE